jgi:hypothetical protein
MSKVIIGIHGLSNKPPADVLEQGWKSAIIEGLASNRNIEAGDINFQSVYWADVMYPHPDPEPDLYKPAKPGALKRYKDGWLDYLRAQSLDIGGDVLDSAKRLFGFHEAADLVLKKKLPDLHRYYTHAEARNELRRRLKQAIEDNKDNRIMLVAHSMGTIVAYDTLRLLGNEASSISIEHLVTIGSPLGMPHVKRKILEESQLVRTPTIVQQWTNLADRRDPVAIDVHLRDDFEANASGVRVVDDMVMNDWGGIHHKSYGYLRTPEFTDLVRSFI